MVTLHGGRKESDMSYATDFQFSLFQGDSNMSF